ncbi:hypothetical protein AMK18_19775 [Streptomyces sp. CB01249]|uniref:hypothetical protein n=1 Tax=Streptomyces sp. CB01249 TaxID=1703929 RepID=UPI00093CBDDC|nr:hypothetical protein [Streptomyces sp. CB01249]OKI99356.1 hypothetical protein AMK18_19775 [Streptomyces sp. CB01249]
MAARTVRLAGALIGAALLPLTACDDAPDEDRTTTAVQAARNYQQAGLDQDYKTVCESTTERWRRAQHAPTIAECVDLITTRRIGSTEGMRISTGKPIDLPPYGSHPAGTGIRVTIGPIGNDMYAHTALRLVPDDDTWLVDQAVNLMDGTDPTAVREALKRKK